MRLIDEDALDTFLGNAEIKAHNQKKYVLAGALNTIRQNVRNILSESSEIVTCGECSHDNNCAIQDIAQTGSKFFCGFAKRKEE